MTKNGITRRDFVKVAGAALAAPSVITSAALGASGKPPPSERITMGAIGIGNMGREHLRCLLGYDEVQILAACDVDRWRREDAKDQVDQQYAADRRSGTYRGTRAYNDLSELLARDDIDAVMIATGANWHGPATVLAAKAGKDIYCEKPISLTIREARAMVEVVRRYGRVAQIGLQQRSFPEFIRACRLVQDGRIGKVKIVYVAHPGISRHVNLPGEPVPDGLDWNLWLGPAPWRPFNGRFHHYGRPQGHWVRWRFSRDLSGGDLAENGVHSLDAAQWGLGMDESGPVEIIPPGAGQYPLLTYKYANGVLLQVGHKVQAFGARFVGEKGWIEVGKGYLQSFPKEILQRPSPLTEPGDRPVVITNHHQNWLQCIKTRRNPVCDVAIGCRSTIVSHLGCIAHWTGRPLKWDPVKEEFVGDEEANRLRFRAMRPPWRI